MEDVSRLPSFRKWFCFDDGTDPKVYLFKFLPADDIHDIDINSTNTNNAMKVTVDGDDVEVTINFMSIQKIGTILQTEILTDFGDNTLVNLQIE